MREWFIEAWYVTVYELTNQVELIIRFWASWLDQ